MTPTLPTLTVEILKALPFKLSLHLNGGSKFSKRVVSNDEWGISVSTETNGSPEYLITDKQMLVDAAPEISLDLRAKDRNLDDFCRRYNEFRADNPEAIAVHEKKVEDEFAEMRAGIEKAKTDRAEKMPTERDAIAAIFEAYLRLKELGWRDAIYCPKDRSVFKAIEIGSTGVHDCFYEGKWPDGSWWCPTEDDLYPSRPCMFRPLTDEDKVIKP